MTASHSSQTNTAIANAVLIEIDIDGAAGSLEFQDSGAAEVATLVLSYPAGTVSEGSLTFDPLADDINATGGIVDRFVIRSNLGGVRILGSVGLAGSGEDIELSSVEISAGDTVRISEIT